MCGSFTHSHAVFSYACAPMCVLCIQVCVSIVCVEFSFHGRTLLCVCTHTMSQTSAGCVFYTCIIKVACVGDFCVCPNTESSVQQQKMVFDLGHPCNALSLNKDGTLLAAAGRKGG